MLKVLIVDDEYVVLKGLEAMLKNQTIMELKIHLANDAIEALKIFDSVMPDVVIADINMPEMDGLAMIEALNNRQHNCSFVIVSGYEKLEYLKKSIKYHVKDYLVKPINKEQLLSVLTEIWEDKDKNRNDSLFKIGTYLTNGLRLDEKPLVKEINNLFMRPYFCVCTFFDDHKTDYNLVFNSLSNCFDFVYFISHGNQILVLINHSKHLKQSEIRSIIDICNQPLQLSFGISKFIQTGRTEFDADKINANTDANLYYQSLCEGLLHAINVDHEIKQDVESSVLNAVESIYLLMNIRRRQISAQTYYDNLFKRSTNIKIAFSIAFIEINVCTLATIGVKADFSFLNNQYNSLLASTVTHHLLMDIVQDLLFNLARYHEINESESHAYSEKITKAVLIINSRYHEDLSLDKIANQIELNPSYLSFLFKKETGKSFLDYIHQKRIEKACDFLEKHKNLSIDQISQNVGYRTPTYFYKVFKDITGLSPNQWRKRESH